MAGCDQPKELFTSLSGSDHRIRLPTTPQRLVDRDNPAIQIDLGLGLGIFRGQALTLGVEQRSGWRWDASVTWTYRGSFYTDAANTAYGAYEAACSDEGGGIFDCEIEEAGEDGEVPDVWLLSARFNLDIGNTGASVFVAGDNLLDELYISDREDGMKPGLGRTIWTGFKYKF